MKIDRHVVVPKAGVRPGQPYSAGIRWDKLLFVAGQTGAHPITREFSPDIKEQTRVALERLKDVAESGGAGLDTAVKVMIHMTDMDEWEAMNEVFRQYFPKDPPARTTVGVTRLAQPGLRVEIDMIAIVRD
jgi:2-iminobutanoate/2-iminopropanoate deaminase